MRNVLILLASAVLLGGNIPAASAAGESGKGPEHRMRDCSKAADPKACEERRAKMRSAMKEAHKACEGRQGAERRDCMRVQMCARAKDPARCEARARERAERRESRKSRQPATKA